MDWSHKKRAVSKWLLFSCEYYCPGSMPGCFGLFVTRLREKAGILLLHFYSSGLFFRVRPLAVCTSFSFVLESKKLPWL
jgi:hypothetical protein